jgi:serine/threonine-protein kinase RsbW
MKVSLLKTKLDSLTGYIKEQSKALALADKDIDRIKLETAANIRFTFPSHTSQLELIRRITRRVATYSDSFSELDLEDIGIAIDEACSNVISHSYGRKKPGEISVEIEMESNKITIILTDRGEEGQLFNPNLLSSFDKEEYLNRLTKGGLGVYLIKKIMDEVEYAVTPGVKNCLTMVKYASPDEQTP